ncbi:MAG: CpsB/CapC family capsule biosynthesis tyrosine phosphatase [Cyclobacteriaceae bacterium]
MLGWLRRRPIPTIEVDLHSHLIPGIDDGVKSVDDSIEIIRKFSELGYLKVITTPHIHPNYPNTSEIIKKGLQKVQERLEEEEFLFEIEAAAEYFVDDLFFDRVKGNSEILSFGNKYVLVESSFLNKPLFFESCLFELMAKGYTPVLAHPERYRFLEGDIEWLEQLRVSGVLMQVTISSFAGYYGEIPKSIAQKLYKKGMIDFLGSDLHRREQLEYLKAGLMQKEVEKLCKSSHLKNSELL